MIETATETQPAPTYRRNRKILRRAAAVVAILVALAIAVFLIWALWIPDPMPEALAAMESDDTVTVDAESPITFAPASQTPTCGFIFYPGARVDARSYGPFLREIAEAGYLAVAPDMLLNLAILSPNRADGVIAAHPEITRWAIGGHSLGGTMAASFAHDHAEQVSGLSLWAAYPIAADSMADRSDLAASSISGTNDGIATPADIEASKPYLPAQTEFLPIEGGNHAQFGWYGDQAGDLPATISREEQQAATVEATLRTMAAACQSTGAGAPARNTLTYAYGTAMLLPIIELS